MHCRCQEMARCPCCGKNGIRVGLLGGACTACGKTERDQVMEKSGMVGQVSYMVRCLGQKDGKACAGLIDIPLNGKGQCPKCGAVQGLAQYRAEHGKIRVKSSIAPIGVKS